jgi:uncharacterized membrane protein
LRQAIEEANTMEVELLHVIVSAIEWTGIIIIVAGLAWSTIQFVRNLRSLEAEERFRIYRADVGRGIMLGLEVLVAADIIDTVALEPTLESIFVLAGIVLIRTFLSFSLEVEVTGHWPWQGHELETARAAKARPSGEHPDSF